MEAKLKSYVLIVVGETQARLLDIDYENYLIAYGCDRASGEEERELLWILSRDSEINEMLVNKINSVLNAHHFEKERIISVRNTVDV